MLWYTIKLSCLHVTITQPCLPTAERKSMVFVFVCVCVLLYVTAATVFYLGSSTSVTKCYVNDTDVKLEPTKVLTN